jgi:hypothetical protein
MQIPHSQCTRKQLPATMRIRQFLLPKGPAYLAGFLVLKRPASTSGHISCTILYHPRLEI